MNATGTKTADRPIAMAMTAPVTSSIARWAASLGGSPCSIHRSTFSTTTIASSTTMPMASTMPNSDSMFSENPITHSTAHVPMSETGTASSGMIDGRHPWRKITTTSTTSAIASSSVRPTSRRLSRMNNVVSYGVA